MIRPSSRLPLTGSPWLHPIAPTKESSCFRRTASIAWPDIDDVEACSGDLDDLDLRGICALQGKYTDLRDQRQNRQRSHDNDCYH